MSIAAVRVGRIPTRELTDSQTRCYRCGQVFDHHLQNVVAGSPCRDCRETLRAEGDETVWRRQRPKATT